MPILAIKYQFLKAIIIYNLTWEFEVSVSIDRKIAALLFFSKICQKSFSLADIFQLHKCQVLAFINVPAKKDNKAMANLGFEKFWQ